MSFNVMNLSINAYELETLAVASVRYSLGRQTYMPLSVMEIIEPYLPQFSENTLAVLDRDITSHERDENLGSSYDAKNWLDFRAKIRKELESR